ncbi:hypothetical protein [Enhygromyxa salina]|uniref:Uncharacterized protein n=1 Tax=Enhygromyxa salina TaxID=215803 RepID=A0A2S9XL92_9BACT|nr:hypothetical protein [Enhygromyxa salina]PRP93625.1 hypothetical protein ENSA7_80530 [Enhygromyxa salina]
MRATWSATFTRISLVTGLWLGLAAIGSSGCTHAGATRARHQVEVEVAGAAALTAETSLDSSRSAKPNGVVDVSELPTVVDMGDGAGSAPASKLAKHRFAPAAMVAATDVASWIDAELDGPDVEVTQIELRNACAVELDYAFGPSAAPDEVQAPRRALDAHTIQTQVVVKGDWLHLWDGDRWLGAAVTTVEHGQMEVSPECDTLTVSVDLLERGLTRFAIHWELEGDAHSWPSGPDPRALTIDHDDAPERWGANEDGANHVELRLANLCAEPIDYVFTPAFTDAPASGSTIPGHTERSVEIPAGWWLRYQTLDSEWRGGATSDLSGAVLWLASNCVDFGVGDGAVIVGPQATHVTDDRGTP